MAAILVAGDALLDVHVIPNSPIRAGADVPASVQLDTGGQGANLAVRLARAGLVVRLACAIGDDNAGSLVRHRLERAGVAMALLPARRTGSVVILVDAAGERTMLSDRVPFRSVLATRIESLVADADWVVLSGYLLEESGEPLGAGPLGGVRRMLVGCPFRDADAWRDAAEAWRPDLLVLNRAEAAALAPAAGAASAKARDLALRLVESGVASTVVVTDVIAVAAAAADGEVVDISVATDPTVVDTTGAGDAFAATLLAELHAAWPPRPDALRTALERAATVATGVARAVGAQAEVDPVRGAVP